MLEFNQEVGLLVAGGRASRLRRGRWACSPLPRSTGSRLIDKARQGKLKGADSKPVSGEHVAIERLRSELARLMMASDIFGEATAYFAKGST